MKSTLKLPKLAPRKFILRSGACAFAIALAAMMILHSRVSERPVDTLSLAIDGYEIVDEIDLSDAHLGVALRADRNGHFRLDARVNGRRLPFLVDTGASYVTLNYADARRVGLSLKRKDFKHEVRTANGRARVAAVRLRSIEYRSIRKRDIVALVTQRGAMETNLLGNSFLSRLKTFRVQNGTLIMR